MLKKHESKHHGVMKTILITFVILMGLAILFDLTPFGGTMKYYSAWNRCGHMPVVTGGSGYWNSGASHYYTPPAVNIFPGMQTYFCTAFDAEKHGYSANPKVYDFPVLKAHDALCKKPTDPDSETGATFSPCKE